ncbi:MAG: Fur family transcriptional regulator [Burkholderiaceae bacterium]|mgnify:FL=1
MNNAQFLQSAAEHCLKNGANLTDLRRQVLDLVLAHDGVVKAYQVLSDLQQARGSAAPPTVYRALEFLVEQGILHRVEALNGYVVCRHLDCAHPSVILTCRDCGKVDEMAADEGFMALRQLCAGHGFEMDEQQLLLNGRCVQCSEQIKKS